MNKFPIFYPVIALDFKKMADEISACEIAFMRLSRRIA
jgi:hypothetical protein